MKLFYKAPMFCVALVGVAAFAFTGCKSTDIAGRYSSKHIKANTNQITAQVPEISELGYVLLSLTDAAGQDTSLINIQSAYYKEVSQHFAAFKTHKAVKLLNAQLKISGGNFASFRNGLYAYKFNDRDNMVLKTDYRTDLSRIDFRKFTSAIEDFAEKSKFREFYKKHNDFYNQLTKQQSQQLTMSATWAIMAKQYDKPFQSYQVIVSPLTKGGASTLAVSGRGFRECFIFTDSAEKVLFYTANVKKSGSTTASN